jgi:diacylglycerol kinase family enzyme
MRLKLHDRLLAALALLVFTVIIFAVVWLLISHLLFAILLCATLIFLARAAWLALSGKNVMYTWLLVIVILALLSELIFFGFTANYLVWVIIILAAAVFAIIVGHLRKILWQDMRSAASQTGITAAFRKPFLIINPKSGNGRAIKAHIPKLAKSQGIEVKILKNGDNVQKIAHESVRSGADVLGISGGDGSIGAVAKVAIENNVPLVVLPGGTRCHFARDIGLDPKRIADALAGFHGVERTVDVGEINGRIFLNNVSFGLYADIVARPEYRGHKRRITREVLQSIASGKKQPYTLQFSHGAVKYNSAVIILVGVNAYDTSNLLEFGQREKLDAGLLQISALTKLDEKSADRIMSSALARKENPDIDQWEATSFKVAASSTTIKTGVDGEFETYESPVRIRVLPKKLRLFVPAEGVRNRPKKIFSPFVLQSLWAAAVHGSYISR